MKYYLVIRKKDILPLATIWMDLDCLLLSEIKQIKYCMISLMCQVLKTEQRKKET